MSLNDTQIQRLQNLYNDESLGLTTEKNYMIIQKQMVRQVIYTFKNSWFFKKVFRSKPSINKKKGDISFAAEGPLDQFQIDLIYMPKSWFNHGFKYIFACVDVFSEKADMVPLKDRE
jgi:hypothetical protein